MTEFVDLSRALFDAMPGFSISGPDGRKVRCTARIHEALSHEDTAPLYENKAGFAFTEIAFHGNIGTYVDAPYARHAAGRDVADLGLDELILRGHLVSARGLAPGAPLPLVDMALPDDVRGTALVFDFGWAERWGTEAYTPHPFIAPEAVDELVARGVKLVAMDTGNADDLRDLARPAHTKFLANDVLIVENLCNLEALAGRRFRFFALPVKARGAGSMPVRAFAEILDDSAGEGP